MLIRFHGNQGKLSKISHIDPILLNFARCDGAIVINLHAKNEGNLPHGFRDRPIATERQPLIKFNILGQSDLIQLTISLLGMNYFKVSS